MVRQSKFKSPHLEGFDAPSDRANAAEIVYWAAKRFGNRLAVTSSFQTQSIPLLYMISRICPNTPILFLDTGYHFSETLAFRDELKRSFGLNIVNLRPLMGHQQFKLRHDGLYHSNPNMCCYLNKVEPLQRELKKYSAWISGIRRDQTDERSQVPVVSFQEDGLYKICPMVAWTDEIVNNYIERLGLPQHPLHQFGFRSIGCNPCTMATTPDQDARLGRWAENQKTECGLHENLNQSERQEKK